MFYIIIFVYDATMVTCYANIVVSCAMLVTCSRTLKGAASDVNVSHDIAFVLHNTAFVLHNTAFVLHNLSLSA